MKLEISNRGKLENSPVSENGNQKIKSRTTTWSSIYISGYLSEEKGNTNAKIHAHLNSLQHYNNQDTETTKKEKEVTKKTRMLPFAIFIQHGTRSSSQGS